MKRTNKPLLLLGWLLWMATGGGCTQTEVEEKDIPPHALKEVEVAFNLHVLANQSSTTRSASADTAADTIPTRAGTDMENGLDSKIASLWVGQYNTSGTLLYHYYNDNMTNNTINVKLKQNATGDDSNSHVWFVVNTGDLGKIATEDELKQHVLTYSHDNGLPSPRLCTMSGMWEGVVKEEGGASSITVNVTRLLAKITFSYKIDEATHAFSFTPDSIMLKSVPDRMQVDSAKTQLAGVAYQTYKETEFTADADGKVTKYWYLPENMAGTGDAVDAKKKKTGKGVTNATYIKLAGTAVQGGVTYKDVVFCFYPGIEEDDATVFNNYDIVRNSHYQMDATLVGLDATDERITVGEIPPIEVTGGNMPAEKGGTKEVQITARPGQEWVFDLDLWLKATIEGKDAVTGAQITHQGPAKVTFEATEANPKAEQRSIEFSVNVGNEPQKFTITQEGSTLQKGDGIMLEAASGSTAASTFTATKGLKWQLDRSTEDWWSWADGQATSGDDTQGTAATGTPQALNVKALSSNPSATPRTGTATVKAGASTGPGYDGLIQEIPVTQAGSEVTGSTINDIAAEGATGDAPFTATQGLDWRSPASSDWITLNSGGSGNPTTGAPQNINYTAAVNPSSSVRSGTITVQAGNTEDGPTGTITLTQKAASLTASVDPTTALAATPDASGTLRYQATQGLPLFVTVPDWLVLTDVAPETTTGSEQTIGYKTKSLNLNSTANTGNISVKAGEMTEDVAVTQDGSIFSVTNGADTIPKDGGSTTGSVKATAGLSWSISPETYDGITVSPITGTGDATLIFTASANAGSAERTGTFTVSVTGASPARTVSVTAKQAGEIGAYVGNLQVCKTEKGRINWSAANSYCSGLTAEGKKDWRLPLQDELITMYNNKSLLQAVSGFVPFSNAYYWSNEVYSSSISSRPSHCIVDLSNGNPNSYYDTSNAYVRCVRDI